MCRRMCGGCIASSFQNDLLARLDPPPVVLGLKVRLCMQHGTTSPVQLRTLRSLVFPLGQKSLWRMLLQMYVVFRSAKLLHNSCSRLNGWWRTVQKNPPAIPTSAISGACMRTHRGNNYSVMHLDLLTVGKRLTAGSVKAYSKRRRCRSGWRF